MTKHFCDICKKELGDKNQIRIGAYGFFTSLLCCVTCFQDPKRWKTIQSRVKRKH